VVLDTERAASCLATALDILHIPVEVKCLPAGARMALIAEMRAVETDKECNFAAKAALVVDELVSVLLAGRLPEA